MRRRCQSLNERGEPCGQAPLQGQECCYWHDPENAAEAAEARRLGGLRRRRERTLHEAYSLEGLDTVAGVRRLLEVAVTEALPLDNSLARSRVLLAASHAAIRLLEAGEFDERLKALEAALGRRPAGQQRR